MIPFELIREYIIPYLSEENELHKLKCVCRKYNNYITIHYPIEIIMKSVIPYLSSEVELNKLKCVYSRLNEYIKCHPIKLICDNCGSSRFSVCSNVNRCIVNGCMVKTIFHPAKIYFLKDKQFCGMGCGMSYFRNSF